tara:strand:+ start:289 stop:732 length:444 start_codon:yes stop_codon:yes gene_type:complete
MLLKRLMFKKKLFANSVDWALLLIRIIPSFYLFYYHGYKKILGGTSTWEWLGEAVMPLIGIKFGYIFFGFFAALSEAVFTWFVALGLFTRFSSLLIIITMAFAGLFHLFDGENAELAFIYLTIYIFILITGPGRYSLDRNLFTLNKS